MVVVYILKGQRRDVRPVRPRSYIDFEKHNAAATAAARRRVMVVLA